jgi:hypothetical protein
MGILGMIGAGIQNRAQRRLMDKQKNNQMQLNRQGHELQMDMWNKTNYGAQVDHMRDAGLNPALMYQQGGSTGTTGSQSGGSAQSGNAAQVKMMDLGSALTVSQIAKVKEEANLVKEEARERKFINDERDSDKVNFYAAKKWERNMMQTMGQKSQYEWTWDVINKYNDPDTSPMYEGIQRDLNHMKGGDKNSPEAKLLAARVIYNEANALLTKERKDLTKEQRDKIIHEVINMYLNTGIKGANTLLTAKFGGQAAKRLEALLTKMSQQ